MKKEGTDNILNSKKQDKENNFYWKELELNYKEKSGEDSVYLTATIISTLINTWATQKGKRLMYDVGTPAKVRQAIDKGIRFLKNRIKQKHYDATNAFFMFQNA